MRQGFVRRNYSEIVPNLATPYKKFHDDYYRAEKSYTQGASAVHLTSEDLGKWIIYLSELFKENSQIAKYFFEEGKTNNNEKIPYGFGTFLGDISGHKVMEHGGECEGYRSAMSFIPDINMGIGIMSNNGSMDLWQIVRHIYNLYLNDGTVNKEEFSNKPNDTLYNMKSKAQSCEDLNSYVGRFFIELGAIVETYTDQHNLRWRIHGITGFDYPLQQIKDGEFLDQDGDPVSFRVNKEGAAISMTLQWTKGPVEATALTDEFNLHQYVGIFYCKELGILLNIVADKSYLYVSNDRFRNKEFIPFSQDSFTGEDWWNNQLYYIRDSHMEIRGLKILIRDEAEIIFNKL